MSSVICHLSPVTNAATATVIDPPPANSSTMRSRLVCKDSKTQKQNIPRIFIFVILANISNTLFNQSSPVHREAGFPGGDNIPRTLQLVD